uniref:Response regulator receiver protein n=1 Tax=uncultured bacterium Contigcl_1787 TaxID=1393662 RepID=W0FRN9_9BACT|nr:response regulator receiver protein [uncultured bacterium Contigcl_1787]
MKVLIIDDDSMMLRMASFIVKKAGHEALTAQSGEEGVALARSSRPDIVFIDVEMLVMDGFAAAEQIKSDDTLSGTRICMMSGTVTDEVVARAKQLGAVGVTGKPLNAGEIINIING